MAFDPKVAAGGVAVVAIGGGAGVAIHQGTSGSSETKENPIKLAIEEAEFTLKTSDSECVKALEKDLSDENYKAAVVACVNENTFKARVKKLGLDTLETTKISEASNTEWTNKWKKQQATIKTLKESGQSDWSSLSDGATKIKSFCDKNTNIETNTKTEDWYKFLKICIKEDEDSAGKSKKLAEVLERDFWYYKETIRTKMKSAGFGEQESKTTPCEESKLHEVYDLTKYKKAIKNCAKSKKFRERAEELKLDAIPDSNEDNFWSSGWEEVKAKVKGVVTDLSSSEEGSWSNAKTKVKKYCTDNNKTIDESTKDSDWKNYLKACTKDKGDNSNKVTTDSVLKRDFWTNK